jgi:hypothetical protein
VNRRSKMSLRMANRYSVGHFLIPYHTHIHVILRQQQKSLVAGRTTIPSVNETLHYARVGWLIRDLLEDKS